MRLFVLMLLLLYFGFLDAHKMWKKRDWYEMVIFGAMLVVGIAYGVVFVFNIPLPDPNGLIKIVFEPIGKQFMKPFDS